MHVVYQRKVVISSNKLWIFVNIIHGGPPGLIS